MLFEKVGPYTPRQAEWSPHQLESLLISRWGENLGVEHLVQYLVVAQHHFGEISSDTISWLQQTTGCSQSHIQSLLDFYYFLRQEPAPSYMIYLANNIIEQQAGLEPVYRTLQTKLKPSRARLHLTSCIGLSDQPLSALVNGHAISRIKPANVDELCELILNELPLQQWPQHWFAGPSQLRHPGPLTQFQYQPGSALAQLESLSSQQIIDRIQSSGLRGLGGAGFPTAHKWQHCLNQSTQPKFVICNADEGEPGTFKDRYYLMQKLDAMVDGMIIAAKAIQASAGYIYLRAEYINLYSQIEHCLQQKRAQGWLGKDFDVELQLGAGAYVCGEESALMESIEGKRGIPRSKPPYPGQCGLFGAPTIVNNVETFVAATYIMQQGSQHFSQRGTTQSKGSRLLSVSGDCKHPGLYELAMGTPLTHLLDLCGAANTQAVQVGGPSGHLYFQHELDTALDFESHSGGSGIMIFNQERDLTEVAQNFMAFFQHECCGFCTPCRAGTQMQSAMLQQYQQGKRDSEDLIELCDLMKTTSQCGLGKTAGNPLMNLLRMETGDEQ